MKLLGDLLTRGMELTAPSPRNISVEVLDDGTICACPIAAILIADGWLPGMNPSYLNPLCYDDVYENHDSVSSALRQEFPQPVSVPANRMYTYGNNLLIYLYDEVGWTREQIRDYLVEIGR